MLEGLPAVSVDRERITQVLHNLLANAVRYTLNNGRITVMAKQNGEDLKVIVSDTGRAIPPEELPYIFERFYRVDKAHGGSIWVESTLEKGTTFSFTLPLA